MNLKVNLDHLTKDRTLYADTIRIGEYEMKASKDGATISKVVQIDDLIKSKVVIEIKNDDVIVNGRSIEAIYNALENHYHVLSKLVGESPSRHQVSS
jgi:pyrimidine operon attenuation protein/uracil phosphoribosyltransferase